MKKVNYTFINVFMVCVLTTLLCMLVLIYSIDPLITLNSPQLPIILLVSFSVNVGSWLIIKYKLQCDEFIFRFWGIDKSRQRERHISEAIALDNNFLNDENIKREYDRCIQLNKLYSHVLTLSDKKEKAAFVVSQKSNYVYLYILVNLFIFGLAT